MLVNDYLLDVYLGSADGETLVEGFEALVRLAAKSADTWVDAKPVNDDSLSPEGVAFLTFFHGVGYYPFDFRGVWPAVLRQLPAAESVASSQAASRVYLDLLEAGFEATDADCKTHDRYARAIGVLDPQTKQSDVRDEDADQDDGSGQEAEATDVPPASPSTVIGGEDPAGLKRWAGNIEEISFALHLRFPKWFVPYGFSRRFHHFDAICAEFGIALPRLPGKSSRRELAEYYLSINRCLQEYRREVDLAPAEFNAFLYDFASQYVDVADADEFESPERVWLLLGQPVGDYEWLEAANEESKSFWQGSDGIRPGDLCVMWVRSPHSCTHSVWRAISRGYNDPFFWHYRTVWIGHPTVVPRIKFKELSAHPTWAVNPSLRAHFQGASGREISPAEYEALLEMWKARGFDTAKLPKLARRPPPLLEGIESERDVEERLLEPLLHRLGYEDSDWIRQYRVRMGRGEVVRPDYAFGLEGDAGEESVQMIVEAKHRISSRKALREAYVQARSYAERLRAWILVLCALEGCWVFFRDEGTFSIERCEQLGWQEANQGKALDDLLRRLGRDVVLKGVDRKKTRVT